MAASRSISVVIPAYNADGVIGAAIESALAQTLPPLEIIIVDDGSPEDLGPAARKYDGRVRIVRHETKRGAGAARNTGIKAAVGDYVAFLDADDSWLPQKLELQLRALASAGTDTCASVTGFWLRRASGRQERWDIGWVDDWYRAIASGCNVSPGTTLVAERECYHAVGLYDESLWRLEDWDWLLRYAERFSIAAVDTPLAVVNILSKPKSEIVEKALDDIESRHLERARRRGRGLAKRLKSTLVLERAAIKYRQGCKGAALGGCLRALLIDPFRPMRFYQRLGRLLGDFVR